MPSHYLNQLYGSGRMMQSTTSAPRFLTLSFTLSPGVLHKQQPNSPVSVPIRARNSQIFYWKSSHRTLAQTGIAAILFSEIHWPLSLPPYLNNPLHGWYQNRGLNWPAGFDICAFNPRLTHGLCLPHWVATNGLECQLRTVLLLHWPFRGQWPIFLPCS